MISVGVNQATQIHMKISTYLVGDLNCVVQWRIGGITEPKGSSRWCGKAHPKPLTYAIRKCCAKVFGISDIHERLDCQTKVKTQRKRQQLEQEHVGEFWTSDETIEHRQLNCNQRRSVSPKYTSDRLSGLANADKFA